MQRDRRLLAICCTLLAFAGSALAAQPSPPAAPVDSVRVPLDVVLVLDDSASMRRVDPGRLMRRGVRDFALALGDDTQLAVVVFGERADVALPLGPVRVGTLEQALGRLAYRAPRTDIPGGVERALYALRTGGRPDVQRAVVVFTDGVVDLGSAARTAAQSRWLREDLADEARALGVPIFGIAFTDAADVDLMQTLARATGGSYFRVADASGIADAFAHVRERVTELARRWIPEHASPPPAATFAVDTATLAAALGMLGVLVAVFVRIGRRRPGEAAMPKAELRAVDPDGEPAIHRLRAPVTRIGRAKDNDVVLPCDTVSAHHALIEWRGGSFHLKDLGSSNGTRRNGKLVSDREQKEPRSIRLRHRDRIAIDRQDFEFVLVGAADLDETRVASLGIAGALGDRQAAKRDGTTATMPLVMPPGEMPGDGPATGTCLIHETWPAFGACNDCGKAWCQWCLTERDGKRFCRGCAEKAA